MIDNEIAGNCSHCSSIPSSSRRLFRNLLPNIGAGPTEGGATATTFAPAYVNRYWAPPPMVTISGYDSDEDDDVSGPLYNDPRNSLAWRLRRGYRR
jgi:hypothetical protein